MGKLKSFLICAMAAACPVFICGESAFGSALRSAAYISAGAFPSKTDSLSSSGSDKPDISDSQASAPESSNYFAGSSSEKYSSEIFSSERFSSERFSSELFSGASSGGNSSGNFSSSAFGASNSQSGGGNAESPPASVGTVIRLNQSELVDDTDYSVFTAHSGAIRRFNYGKYSSSDYINLSSGAQVRNCTKIENSVLEAASELLPTLSGNYNPSEPQVLIYHTHTTESFLPEENWYDDKYPTRSFNSEKNITAVGDALCEALAKRGISSVHDCTVHDYPSFTKAYQSSAETIKRNLRQYPSIKIIIDLHRDGIVNSDGSLSAPIAEVNGKNAAQFMIISGCDDGTFDMPNYIENFKLACLLQNCAEAAYPSLARAVLFDYRCYNQNLFSGGLLIEVGSHGNSLDEVVYTGELLGNVIADALEQRFTDV